METRTEIFFYNFRNQFSYNFEPEATKSMTTGRSATSKL